MKQPDDKNPAAAIAARLSALPGPLRTAPPQFLEQLASAGKLVKAGLGRVLVQPHQMPPAVFIVLEGRVRMLGIFSKQVAPELLLTLRPGGVAGLGSLLAGIPVEAETVSEDCVCLMVAPDVFAELLGKYPEFAGELGREVHPADVYNLVGAELARTAQDSTKASEIAKNPSAPARFLDATQQDEDGDFLWLVARGPSRGLRWEPGHGPVPRIGVPLSLLGGSAESGLPESDQSEPPALPPAETLLDPLADYPVITTNEGPVEQVIACYEMLAKFFAKSVPREPIRRVLVNELQGDREPTLNTCGTVASMAGFISQLIRVPASALARIEAPGLLFHDGAISVLYQTGPRGAVVASPLTGMHRLPIESFVANYTGEVEVLLLRPLPSDTKEKFSWRWFLPAIRKHKRVLTEVFIASFFIQLLSLANPLLTQIIIDKVLIQNSIATLNVLGTLFVLIAVATVALTAVRTYLFYDTTNRIDLSVGSRIMDHLYRLTLGYFQRRPVGEVSSRLRELENIREFLTGTALTVGLDAIFSVIYIAIMLFYNVGLTLVALVVVPFMAGVVIFAAPILQRQIRRRAEAGARSQAHLVETISGVQTLKAGNIEQPSRWEWQKRYADFVTAGFHSILTATAANSATTLISRLGDLAVLWYGAVLVIRGELTLGQLIAFRIIAGYVTTPLMRLAQSWQNFQEVALSIERLGDVIDSPCEQLPEETSNIPMGSVKGEVEFDDITFSYVRGQQPVLRNVSFRVPAGSFVGVVGKSGSGKSTILKLLPRLYRADLGRILVDGYEIDKVELYSLRRQIGTVLQDSLLFNSSVYANIAIGDPDAAPDDIMRAARVAGAHDFIMSLAQGYNTPVGEQGRALSGGQRQRIAIARAVLQHPRLVILDEATSALDSLSEHTVCKNLAAEFKGKTVFFVTHRVRSVEHADHILVFDSGVIVEQGKHDELFAAKGYYHSLYVGGQKDE
jgi:HlyB family type I secretion system ABC transporter